MRLGQRTEVATEAVEIGLDLMPQVAPLDMEWRRERV
jgi:hypothetical protein